MWVGKSNWLGKSWIVIAGAIVLPGEAFAGWGDEIWGTLIWSAAISGPGVPGLGLLGTMVLSTGLVATALWTLRKQRLALRLTLVLVLLVIPLAVVAGTVTLPHTFENGTVADADQVNENFDAVKVAVDDNDSRITAGGQGLTGLERIQVNSPFDFVATKEVLANCPVGKKVIGGGYVHFFGGPTVVMRTNAPTLDLSGWTVSGTNLTGEDWSVSALAICADAE